MLPLDDPCAAVGRRLVLPPKRKEKVRFVLSFAAQEQAAKALLEIAPKRVLHNALRVDTPDKALNHMVSSFLPAQILNSRIFGRTAFYQNGGAWGFRDQLQDVGSMILLRPRLARQQILRAAACQFPEGDVLHWWHRLPGKNGLRGVRTRYSDDLLWLPYVTAEYIKQTGDASLLHLKIPYLEGEALRDGEHERYFEPTMSAQRGTLYEHCLRAIEHAARFGAHGLPLIGGGDWNDGFNRVGIQGRGESVWLAQFMALTLDEMRPVCKLMEDESSEARFAQRRRNCAAPWMKPHGTAAGTGALILTTAHRWGRAEPQPVKSTACRNPSPFWVGCRMSSGGTWRLTARWKSLWIGSRADPALYAILHWGGIFARLCGRLSGRRPGKRRAVYACRRVALHGVAAGRPRG